MQTQQRKKHPGSLLFCCFLSLVSHLPQTVDFSICNQAAFWMSSWHAQNTTTDLGTVRATGHSVVQPSTALCRNKKYRKMWPGNTYIHYVHMCICACIHALHTCRHTHTFSPTHTHTRARIHTYSIDPYRQTYSFYLLAALTI